MYYLRQFKGGGGDQDPRQKLWGEFKCDTCGKLEWVEIKQPNLFQYDKIITCPKCGSKGKDDLIKALETKKTQLELEHVRIKAEIEKVIKELDSFKQEALCNQP